MLKIIREDFTNHSLKIIEKRILKHLDMGEDFMVILPNRQLIQYFKEKVLEKREVFGGSHFFTFDDLLQDKGNKDFNTLPLVEYVFLEAVKNLKDCKEIEESQSFQTEGFRSISLGLLSTIRNSGLDVSDLLGKTKSKRLKIILLILQEMESLLLKYKIPDPFMEPEIKVDSISLYRGHEIYIDGFYEFRPTEYDWIEKQAGNNIHIFYHTSKATSPLVNQVLERLYQIGFQEEFLEGKKNSFEALASGLFLEEISEREDLFLTEAGDEFLQAKAICLDIKRNHLQGVDLEDMTLVLVNPDQRTALCRQLEAEKIPFSRSQETPLLKEKLFKELYNLLQVHPDNQSFLLANLGNTILLEIEEDLSFQLKQMVERKEYVTIEEYRKDPDFSEMEDSKAIRESFLKLEDWRRGLYEDEISGVFRRILETIKGLKVQDERGSRFNSILLYLDQLQHQHLNWLESLSRRNLLDLILKIFEDTGIQNKELPQKGVQIKQIQQIRLLENKILFFPDFNEKYYPKVMESNFFLNEDTVKELKELGVYISNREEEIHRNQLVFLAALASIRKYAYFYYQQKDLPSFYTRDLGLKKEGIEKVQIKDFLRPKSENISTFEDLQRYKVYETFESHLSGRHKVELKKNYSVTELETYLQCPQRYYYRYVMKIKEERKTLQSEETILLGILCHDVLEAFYKSNLEKIRNLEVDQVIDSLMNTNFIRENMDWFGEQLGFNLSLSRIRVEFGIYEMKLKETILKDLLRLKEDRDPYLPFEFEKDFKTTFVFQGKQLRLRGRMDRKDKNAQGKFKIVDYKLGRGSVRTLNDFSKNKTLQFPIYALGKNVEACEYISIKKAEIYPFFVKSETQKGSFYRTEVQLKEFQEDTIEKVTRILEGIQRNEFSRITIDLRDCDYCEYKRICLGRREK